MGWRDKTAVTDLIEQAIYAHHHADWYDWRYWLDIDRFWLSWEARPDPVLSGGLVIASEVPSVAWVRTLALHRDPFSRKRLMQHTHALFSAVLPTLKAEGVQRIFWMSDQEWVQRWARQLGFRRTGGVMTFAKDDVDIPHGLSSPSDVQIRPAAAEDMRQLAHIEAAVYAPMWQHTQISLLRAYKQSISFQVARWQGRLVGFQHSTAIKQQGAHLARITVSPQAQGLGVGRLLLIHALKDYAKQGCNHVTLNTQAENGRAQHLYRRFGFLPTGHEAAIWELLLEE